MESELYSIVYEDSARSKFLFNFNWLFHYGDLENGEDPGLDDSEWRNLDLPHDWSIEDLPGQDSPFDSTAINGISMGYLKGGTSWYRKNFHVPKKLNSKRISIIFEGIYMNADVWLNGKHLGNHPYGYTSFYYDITEALNFGGENVLAVEVKNEGSNSRWYPGSGINRNVWLSVTNPLHIANWGTFITTPEITPGEAAVTLELNLVNALNEDANIDIVTTIIDPSGKQIASTTSNESIGAGSKNKFLQNLEVSGPHLWSPDSPELYTALTEIKLQDKLIDEKVTTFGIRKIEFSTEGFFLNGENVLLKGACVHHGNGPLGAAAYDRAEERRVELMKASGFNAIRCAHNPPSPAFLDACDRLGILVIDESFDMWRYPKRPDDYSNYFDEWWEKDLESMILRDRNHPSIIMWSTGNEIPERGRPEGVETSKELVEFVKKLDSTRPVTAAVNGLTPDKDPYFATLDIAGYNYAVGGDHWEESLYTKDHNRVSDRIIYCAESYPLEAFGSWMSVKEYPYVIGDFVWTGFDYLGEASIGWLGYPHEGNFYPWNHAFCGDIDICGFKRPQSWYRNVLWEHGKQLSLWVTPPEPSFPLNPDKAPWSKWEWQDVVKEWNWEKHEGEIFDVYAYSAYEEVELFLNGNSLGKKATSQENEWIASWEVLYQSGELLAIAYEEDEIIDSSIIKTAKETEKILLTPDRTQIKANGQDLCYITVDLVDREGIRNPEAENLIHFSISGPAEVLATGSSNPRSTESFRQPKRKAWKGRCLLIVKTTREAGEIVVTAKAEGLDDTRVILSSETH